MTGKSLRSATLLAGALLVFGSQASARALNPSADKAVRAATFEVVLKKPEADPIEYEKPLPMELVPFHIRNDKYLPVGTAFAVGPNTYVSAGHVFAAFAGSHFGLPLLRDGAGRVHEVDSVRKFSMLEDFIVFTLRSPPSVKPLKTASGARVNTTVHAVGNALGEGIVIRDGLYTSDTPEEMDGKWKWMRFSAAASPGSSGGPLLDEEGRAVGLVVRRSPNENLNFALPISRVINAPDGRGHVHGRSSVGIPLMTDTILKTFESELTLPMALDAFMRTLIETSDRQIDEARAEWLKVHGEKVFPRGADSLKLLHAFELPAIAGIAARLSPGPWQFKEPSGQETIELPKDGTMVTGSVPGAGFLRLWNPDDIDTATLFGDSKAYMQFLVKGMQLTRNVGPEKVRITSLGAPQTEREHVDSWGRKWQLRAWPMAFTDLVVVSLALPLPDGVLALLRFSSPGQLHGNVGDLQYLADFAYVQYAGTLEQWRHFLEAKPLHPQAFSKIDIGIEYDKFVRFRSPRFEVSVPADVQRVTPTSELLLDFSFLLDDGKPAWDVVGLAVVEERGRPTYLDVARRSRPPESLGKDAAEDWRPLLERTAPFDRRADTSDGPARISTSFNAKSGHTGRIAPDSKVIYQVSYSVEGGGPPSEKEMRAFLDAMLEGVKVFE